MDADRRSKVINAAIIALVFLIGVEIGFIAHLVPADTYVDPFGMRDENLDQTQSTRSEPQLASIPDHIHDRNLNINRYSIRFNRSSNTTQLFNRPLHDAVLIRGSNDSLYLIADDERANNQVLYTTNVSSPTKWELIDNNYLGEVGAVDDVVYTGTRYIAYANNGIYTTKELERDNWTLQRSNPRFTNDLGAYYDGERVHIYYEADKENVSGPSGAAIGHAVSADGIDNWTHYPPVFRSENEYVVGDFEVHPLNDSFLLFGDYSRKHPKYEVRVWVNDNLYTEFRMLPDPAMTPRSGNTTHTDDYGVQDATITRISNNRYLLITNGHQTESNEVYLHYYIGRISQSSDH